MQCHIQRTFLGLAVYLLLWGSVVSADTETSKDFGVEYKRYELPFDLEGQKYHRFLGAPAPEGLYYFTRLKATANVDDTPDKENIVLIVAHTGVNGPRVNGFRRFSSLLTPTRRHRIKKHFLHCLIRGPMIWIFQEKPLNSVAYPLSFGN